MLELRDVRKSYTTGDFTQVALNDVSITFRDNEFVAVLGPSGSGKTTMLNVVGGLDHYDSGNLVIDGVETSRYKDRDWDTYRNNRIGFVFQSYNLIPHQTVLANVELALTLAGVSPSERRARALEALDEVGLADHVHKRPSQLSGGQMQRVAIARALINDPEILLADEPTGALDTTTSVAIMALLTSIAKDRLVIMVTHNPELAEQYATRIVSLRDGVIESDTSPVADTSAPERERPAARRTRMSFFTAVALSFTNLMTKKGRTLMTSFAGSIGIIGIAAILALANGVNAYILGVEEDTLSMYPLSIEQQGFDLGSLLAASSGLMDEAGGSGAQAPQGEAHEVQAISSMLGGIGTNDLGSLKTFLEGDGGGIDKYVNSIEYSYDVTPQIFASDTSRGVRQVNPDTTFSAIGLSSADGRGLMGSMGSSSVFAQLVDDLSLVDTQYDVVAGSWPKGADETVVVLSPNGGISDLALYAMGLRDHSELDAMVKQIVAEEPVVPPSDKLNVTYDQLMNVTFRLINASDRYAYDEQYKVWADRSDDKAFLRQLVDQGDLLHVVGVVKPTGDNSVLRPGIYYTSALTRHLMDEAATAPIVQQQLAQRDINVFSGRSFADDEAGAGELDLASLVTVDEDAIAKAFTFDQSKLGLDLNGLEAGLSGMDLDLSALKLDPSALPPLDLDSILAGLDLSTIIKAPTPGPTASTTPTPDAGPGLTELLEAYTAFVAANSMDPSDVATNLPAFLASPEGEAALAAAGEGADTALVTRLVEGYASFTLSGGLDPADVATNLPAFLATDEGRGIVGEAIAQPDPQAGLAERLIQEYLGFAVSNGLDPSDVTANLPIFLGSPEGKKLADEAAGLIDTSSLERQLQGALTGYLQKVMTSYTGQVSRQLTAALSDQISTALEATMGQVADNMSNAMSIDQDAFMAAFKLNKNQQELTQLLTSMATTRINSVESNLNRLGYADPAEPSSIQIYPIDFEGKGQVIGILDTYNDEARASGDEARVITYTDLVGALMGSVTDIVNTISYVLVAFVAISLLVSSIMIGVITYISVLERKKEIGILRSIGASKRDIRRVFNAETLIVGFVAGALGVGITFLLTVPTNAIVYANFDVADIAQLPWQAAGVLVLISMALTALAGLIPASAASRKDPVEALRSE